MNRSAALLAAAIVGSCFFGLTAQQPIGSGGFTAAQAEAGHTEYANTCGRCHTYTLLGRKGDPGELPPISSLSAADQKFVKDPPAVPPLAGPVFLSRWGTKTAAQLITRFQVTVSDPNFHFEGVTDETTVNITAYVLQVNGAKAGTQPLTRTTKGLVNSLIN